MIRVKRKKLTAVPVLIILAVALFAIILMVEKPSLVPAGKSVNVSAEGGAGDYFLPQDPEAQLAVFTKLFELYGEDHPEKLEAYPMTWGFAREVSETEKEVRLQGVE